MHRWMEIEDGQTTVEFDVEIDVWAYPTSCFVVWYAVALMLVGRIVMTTVHTRKMRG